MKHILQSKDRPIYDNKKRGTEWRYTQSFSTKADGTLPFRSVGGGFIHDTKTKWTTELNCSLQVTLGPQKLFGLEIYPPYEKQ